MQRRWRAESREDSEVGKSKDNEDSRSETESPRKQSRLLALRPPGVEIMLKAFAVCKEFQTGTFRSRYRQKVPEELPLQKLILESASTLLLFLSHHFFCRSSPPPPHPYPGDALHPPLVPIPPGPSSITDISTSRHIPEQFQGQSKPCSKPWGPR
jgi:hypothetical protein